MPETFESALQARVDTMIDACTRCGKCVEVCPVTAAAGLHIDPHLDPPPFRGRSEGENDSFLPLQGRGSGRGSTSGERQSPAYVIGGVIDILRGGEGSEAARQWAAGCVRSGDCIEACDYGVNPRFLLGMARVAMARAKNDAVALRRGGVEGFRKVARDVNAMSRLQLDDALLARLGQDAKRPAAAPADFVFYTGCNVLKTPHIALLALDIMDALGISYAVMGGPTHCCGVQQLRSGDLSAFGRMAETTLDKLSHSKTGQVISWCPSCHVQFTEMTLPAAEKTRGAKPFDMTPFTMFVRKYLDRLRPLLREPVPMRIALHKHPGVRGVVAAAEDILRAVPGVELVDLHQPAVGLQANDLKPLPAHRRALQEAELKAAEAAHIDALVALYHSDHRELCAHERDFPFQILNLYEVVGMSMGLHRDDSFKRLKMMQDADAILADCADLVAKHGLDRDTTRAAIQTMLDEQPAPLRGNA
jgi:heterodisulfide reductase subunit D